MNENKNLLTSRSVAELQCIKERSMGMKTAREVSGMLGITKRTLQYYNEIGLLKPSTIDAKTGYWKYDEKAISRLRIIRLLRKLKYPVKQIRRILADTDFDYSTAMEDKIKEFEKEIAHLNSLIDLAEEIREYGISYLLKKDFQKEEKEWR